MTSNHPKKCLPLTLKELMKEVKTHHTDKRAYYLEILSMYTIIHYPELRRIMIKCRESLEDELEAIYDIHMTEATDHNYMLYIDMINLKGHYIGYNLVRESLD
jgi:hypothetical protein